MKRILTFALSLTVLHVTLARAAEGRIPIYQPTVITAPGHYVVTRDIASAGSSVITIGDSGSPPFKNVTLDLNGHALSTDGSFPVITINGAFISKGLTIRNGRLMGSGTGFGDGIRGSGGGAFQIRIEDLEISHVGQDGLYLDYAAHVEVVRCHIHDIGGTGILGNALGTASFTGKFLQNTLEWIQETGIFLVNLQGGEISGNVIMNFGLLAPGDRFGILLMRVGSARSGGNRIEGNSISSLAAGIVNTGIYVATGIPQNRIADNVIQGNARGMFIGSFRNRLLGNVCSDNAGTGIQISATLNHLEGNQVQENIGGCGIRFDASSNTFRNNVGGGNATIGAACIVAGNIDLGGNSGL